MEREMSNDFEDDRSESIRPSRSSPIRPERSGGPRPRRDEDDYPPPPSGSSGLKVVLIILGVVVVFGFCFVAICGGALYYGVQRTREAGQRVMALNNYKQIALALHGYHDKNGHFPPVSMRTKDGRPGLSWRVAILPYLEQDSLYRQFKLDEAWDSPTNKSLISRMPRVYAPVGGGPGGDQTHVRVFFGQLAIFDQSASRGMPQISDGMANTIMLVESTVPVTWTEPTEFRYEPNASLPPLGMPNHDYFIVAMADGSVRVEKKTISPEKVKAAITAAGNEKIFLDP
jgi:hypothetical protein